MLPQRWRATSGVCASRFLTRLVKLVDAHDPAIGKHHRPPLQVELPPGVLDDRSREACCAAALPRRVNPHGRHLEQISAGGDERSKGEKRTRGALSRTNTHGKQRSQPHFFRDFTTPMLGSTRASRRSHAFSPPFTLLKTKNAHRLEWDNLIGQKKRRLEQQNELHPPPPRPPRSLIVRRPSASAVFSISLRGLDISANYSVIVIIIEPVNPHLFYKLEELALGGGRVPQQENVDVPSEAGAVWQVL